MARLSGAVDRCQVAVVGQAHARGAGTTPGRPGPSSSPGSTSKPPPPWKIGDAAARAARALYRCGGPAGMTTYRVLMDPEGAATIEPLRRRLLPPRHERRRRTRPPPRRADALLQVLHQGVAAGTGCTPTTSRTPRADRPTDPTGATGSPGATGSAGATGCSGSGGGTAPAGRRPRSSSPSTTRSSRRWSAAPASPRPGRSCPPRRSAASPAKPASWPMTLGSDTAPLDVGRTQRLFTGPLHKAVLRRDKVCTCHGWPVTPCPAPGATSTTTPGGPAATPLLSSTAPPSAPATTPSSTTAT